MEKDEAAREDAAEQLQRQIDRAVRGEPEANPHPTLREVFERREREQESEKDAGGE